MKDGIVFFEKETPTKDSLGVESGIGEIFVIGMNVQGGRAKQHGAELLEGFDDGE